MIGRPSDFTQAIADAICERLADGESLRTICEADDMPSRASVFRWLAAHEDFRNQYACAREEQAESYADEITAIADEAEVTAKQDGESVTLALDATAVARNRLRIDARKWVASKLKPKKYGDKTTTELTGANGGPIQTVTKIELRAAAGNDHRDD